MKILVTGGAGYIGTHALLALIDAGYHPVVIDNFSNSRKESLMATEQLTGGKQIPFYEADVRDRSILRKIFRKHSIKAVIHFAGLKSVGESVSEPLKYFSNNLESTLALLDVMKEHGCLKLVFSSSATVYGDPKQLPLTENHPLSATNPYGRTKLVIEEILTDLAKSDPRWQIAALRYFNPVGAHPSGIIGETPSGPPSNLFPCITQFMYGIRSKLEIFGNDYSTPDGTCIRDYLHVCDLAEGHVAAVKCLSTLEGVVSINLGTGKGYSVMEIINYFQRIGSQSIAYKVTSRRAGDIAVCYADVSKAKKLLSWEAKRDLNEMVIDSLMWQSKSRATEKKE